MPVFLLNWFLGPLRNTPRAHAALPSCRACTHAPQRSHFDANAHAPPLSCASTHSPRRCARLTDACAARLTPGLDQPVQSTSTADLKLCRVRCLLRRRCDTIFTYASPLDPIAFRWAHARRCLRYKTTHDDFAAERTASRIHARHYSTGSGVADISSCCYRGALNIRAVRRLSARRRAWRFKHVQRI